MESTSANNAKQNFGELIDKALQSPVLITKHGRPSVVVLSISDYEELKYEQLKREVRKGFEQFDLGMVSDKTPDEIAESVLVKH